MVAYLETLNPRYVHIDDILFHAYYVAYLVDFDLVNKITIASAPMVVLILKELIDSFPAEFLDVTVPNEMSHPYI
ncbi:MAG TPA: hypothetical protein PK528_13995 [Syntrophorhabdus sp.]|jgi:hypothetical protein|nr:hypothetical protein [Syntrophorhabdus sp.]